MVVWVGDVVVGELDRRDRVRRVCVCMRVRKVRMLEAAAHTRAKGGVEKLQHSKKVREEACFVARHSSFCL